MSVVASPPVPAVTSARVGSTFLNRAGKGNTQPIVFLHGSGPGATAWSNWQYALPHFATRYDALAPDFIGFGKSEHPDPAPASVARWLRTWIDQVVHLLDALDIQKTHIVGNSLGAAVALHLLAERPDRFDRVVLMGPAGAPMRLTRELAVIWGFYDDPSPSRMAQIISWFSWDQRLIGAELEAISRMRFEAAMAADVRRSFESMFPKPFQLVLDELVVSDSALTRIQHPVLLVHGLNDSIVPVETSHHLLGHLGGPTQLHVYNQCSHWTQVEHRDSFHRLLAGFFERAI
jgi:2-hydroxymuconate-semialdehyde hydrolase